MEPLAAGLARRGHEVPVAFCHLTGGAGAVFGQAGVQFVRAPSKSRGPLRYPRTGGFAHLLANVGFDDKHDLFPVACAWRRLMERERPHAMLCDHSPTALLAARCMPDVKRIVLGTGFFCPPDTCPLPLFHLPGRAPMDRQKLLEHEKRVLELANRMLAYWGQPPMDRLAQLYSDVDDTFLLTFAELDHFGRCRPAGATYWGPIHRAAGKRPLWPAGQGKRVYAYLKDFRGLPDLLRALRRRRNPTLVVVDGVDLPVQRQFASETLRFENEPLDMVAVGRECDLAIHNANHGTLCDLLLAGKPMLQVPLTVEQRTLAAAVDRTGAAETAPAAAGHYDEIEPKLEALLTEPRYAEAARRFARKYSDFDPAEQVGRMVARVEELVETGRGGEGETRGHGKDALNARGKVFAG